VEPFQNSPRNFDEFDEKVRPVFKKSDRKVKELEPDQPGFFKRFLRYGLENSLQENFLGQCTAIWEKHCYRKGTISDDIAICLAKMCSFLVDAPKQGMNLEPWAIEKVKRLGRGEPPAYKSGIRTGGDKKINNIIDRLHFDVANDKIDEKQTIFHQSIGKEIPNIDRDLTALIRRMDNGNSGDRPLAGAIRSLSMRLAALRDEWVEYISGRRNPDSFKSELPVFYQKFRDIKPPAEALDDPVVAYMLSEEGTHFSQWALLRASAAYRRWHSLNLVWHMAGMELCYIKCHSVGARDPELIPRTILPNLYYPLITSKKFLDGKREAIMGGRVEELYEDEEV
jgi:RNA dependent RNA polymerase